MKVDCFLVDRNVIEVLERLDEKNSCRISSRLEDVNIVNLDDWQKIKDFQCDAMPRLDKALRQLVQKVAKEV